MKVLQSFKIVIGCMILFISINKLNAQDQSEMMKVWQDYMTPGDVHKMLAKDVGEWKQTITSWMNPGQPPSKSEGTCVNEMILGGRYLQSKQTSTVMGMPMEGINIIGYDNAKKVFHSYWIDNMSTGIMVGEGPYDESTKTITIKGKYFNPMTKTDSDFREVYKLVDDNHREFELFMIENGQEMKNLHVDYERK
jgi:hypothetical protein